MDYKKILEGVVNIINTTEKSDIGFANICAYIGENCPELKESEDERIRKQLLNWFKGCHWDSIDDGTLKRDDIIAWLEKQGEKDKEILILKDQIESLHAVIKALKEVHIIELEKQEWSKEDEEKMVSIFLGIETFCPSIIYGKGKEELLNWLKSRRPQNRWISVDKEVYVKEPVLAQKKDKSDQFEGIVVCCDHTLTPNVYERYMILGDIVPQKQWKPSDEQMDALENAIMYGEVESIGILSLLYNDLKKLKG